MTFGSNDPKSLNSWSKNSPKYNGEYGFNVTSITSEAALAENPDSQRESKFGSLIDQRMRLDNKSMTTMDWNHTVASHWTPTATLKGFVCKAFGLEPAQREEVLVAAVKSSIDKLYKKNKAYKFEIERLGGLLRIARENERAEKVRVMSVMRKLEERIESHSKERDQLALRSCKMRDRLEEILRLTRGRQWLQLIQRQNDRLEPNWEKRTQKTRAANSNDKNKRLRKWPLRSAKSGNVVKKSLFVHSRQKSQMNGQSQTEMTKKSTILQLEDTEKRTLCKRPVPRAKNMLNEKKGSLKERINLNLTRHRERQHANQWKPSTPNVLLMRTRKMKRGSVRKMANGTEPALGESLFKSTRNRKRPQNLQLLESSFLNLDKSGGASKMPMGVFMKAGKSYPEREPAERKNPKLIPNLTRTEWVSMVSPRSRSGQSSRSSDEDKWREVLDQAMQTFQTVADAARLQTVREQKIRNVMRALFKVKSENGRRGRVKGARRRSSEQPSTSTILQTRRSKRSKSALLVKVLKQPLTEGKVTLLEDKLNRLLNERNELEKKNKKKQQKLIEDIMNEKVYADSLRDITVKLERRLARRTNRMRGILEKHGLGEALELSDEEPVDMSPGKGRESTTGDRRGTPPSFNFEREFTIKVGGQEKGSSRMSAEFDKLDLDEDFEDDSPDLNKEEKKILKFKKQIDDNKQKISELTTEQKEIKSDLTRLEEKIKESDSMQRRKEAQDKRRKIAKYKEQISALVTRNVDLEEEIRHKRKAVDEYSRARADEMREMRRMMYNEYLVARQRMDQEREANQEVIAKHKETIQMRNLEMVQMINKFQRVKKISDRLKKHYRTLRDNGIDVGSEADCRWRNASRRVARNGGRRQLDLADGVVPQGQAVPGQESKAETGHQERPRQENQDPEEADIAGVQVGPDEHQGAHADQRKHDAGQAGG